MLDFWGYWCGPCLRAMPALIMALHDQFADKGVVVIAVHDGSVKSIAEMDERIAAVRARQWFGRDLPFLVALDGAGASTTAYGIASFPTSLLIDRDGNVVRRLEERPRRPRRQRGGDLQAARRPCEASFLAGPVLEAYRLAPDEVLRHVKPPFIPERAKFITRELSSLGNEGAADVSLVLPWNGAIQARYPLESTLPSVLRRIAEDSRGYRARQHLRNRRRAENAHRAGRLDRARGDDP